jgi:deazaflavin-dependent oxidoreductase (nitroreductase family)
MRRLVPLDRRILLRTQGRRSALGPSGAPTLLLATTGRRSGLRRLTPLVFAWDGDSVIVVGSNFGRAQHPGWSSNLIAHPSALVTVRGQDFPVEATLLEGAEEAAAFQRIVDLSAAYLSYQARTSRRLRLFRLTPAIEPATPPE